MRLTVNTIAATSTIRTRKNSANGAQSVSIGSNATGVFEDTSNTDTIAVGDKIAIQTTPGATVGTMTLSVFSMLFDATTNTVTKYGVQPWNTISTASTTFFQPLSGTAAANTTTEANVKCRQRKAGIFASLAINVSSNARTATTLKTRKNGADATLTLSITASTSGFFEDTTHSDAVVVDDDFNFALVTGTGTAALQPQDIEVVFRSTDSHNQLINSKDNAATIGTSATNYFTICGNVNPFAAEADCKTKSRLARYAFRELTINLRTNTVSAASTFRLRKNGANANQSVSITASTAGVFSDSTNVDIIASSDDINYQLVTGASGTSMIPIHMSVWATGPIPATVYIEWEES